MQVTFVKPFTLVGIDGVQPPGCYAVSLEEEQLDVLSFVGWRQIAATLQLKRGGSTEYAAINMQDLRDALLRDSAQSSDPQTIPASKAVQSPRMREMLRLQGRGW